MNASFHNLLPGLAEQLAKISDLPLIQRVNETAWIFAIVETTHLLFLAILGGAVLVLNLKLLGAALPNVPAGDVERTTRPWLIVGLAGTMVTGILMGLTTLHSLLGSAAFLVKMVSLVAAILFSLAVVRRARQDDADGAQASGKEKLLVGFASLWWLASLVLFLNGDGLRSGAFLVALAGFALFAALVSRWRRVYFMGLAIILGGGIFVVEWISGDGVHGPAWLPLLPLAGASALAAAVVALERREVDSRPPSPARAAAFASTLAWITVAAAGRWIGFS